LGGKKKKKKNPPLRGRVKRWRAGHTYEGGKDDEVGRGKCLELELVSAGESQGATPSTWHNLGKTRRGYFWGEGGKKKWLRI